jgi:hypothetical protein
MGQMNITCSTLSLGTKCYRLTDIGRACVELVETEHQTIGSLSRHLHDVLMLCGTGIWFEQLRQFMPPRSLDESLRALLNLGLIEVVHPDLAPRYDPPTWPQRSQPAYAFAMA